MIGIEILRTLGSVVARLVEQFATSGRLKRKIESYLNRWANQAEGERGALIVRGVRQIGKTYSVKSFLSENFEGPSYTFDFEKLKTRTKSPLLAKNEHFFAKVVFLFETSSKKLLLDF